jgi:hypothetical protein
MPHALVPGSAPGWPYVPSTVTMTALWEEVGTPGAAATDTRASTAIELTRAWP